MILSRSSEYGIELVLYLMTHEAPGFASLRTISDETGLSFHYLSKIARMLTRRDILKSYRGPRGGVTLGKPAAEITLFDVVHAIEGDALFEKCILRPGPCQEENPCPIHEKWLPIRDRIRELFMETSIEVFQEPALTAHAPRNNRQNP